MLYCSPIEKRLGYIYYPVLDNHLPQQPLIMDAMYAPDRRALVEVNEGFKNPYDYYTPRPMESYALFPYAEAADPTLSAAKNDTTNKFLTGMGFLILFLYVANAGF